MTSRTSRPSLGPSRPSLGPRPSLASASAARPSNLGDGSGGQEEPLSPKSEEAPKTRRQSLLSRLPSMKTRDSTRRSTLASCTEVNLSADEAKALEAAAASRGKRRTMSLDPIVAEEIKEKVEQLELKTVFLDTDAMKEKVRQNLLKPEHRVADYYKEEGCWPRIATSLKFEQFTLLVIGFNAIWIAIDTDENDAELLVNADLMFIVAENFFCAFFFFEWLVRFMSFRKKRFCFKDAWFVFDSFLVLLMVLEVWVMTLVVILSSGGGAGGMGNASVLRIARLMRLSRMARVARLLRAMPELMILIKGMLSATRSVFFTLCLLMIIMYVFGIAFTQLCKGTDIEDEFFSSVSHSMYSLMMYGTLLDDIGVLAGRIGDVSPLYGAVFFLFVLMTALTVMNMLIGVLCEVVSAVAATEKEEMLVNYVNLKLKGVLDMVDIDGDNMISKKEFISILENAEAVKALQDVGVDVVGLVDFSDYIFTDELGGEDEDGEMELTFGKFMEIILQFRGNNIATVKDIVDLRKFVRNSMNIAQKEITDAVIKTMSEATGKRLSIRSSKRSSTGSAQLNAAAANLNDVDVGVGSVGLAAPVGKERRNSVDYTNVTAGAVKSLNSSAPVDETKRNSVRHNSEPACTNAASSNSLLTQESCVEVSSPVRGEGVSETRFVQPLLPNDSKSAWSHCDPTELKSWQDELNKLMSRAPWLVMSNGHQLHEDRQNKKTPEKSNNAGRHLDGLSGKETSKDEYDAYWSKPANSGSSSSHGISDQGGRQRNDDKTDEDGIAVPIERNSRDRCPESQSPVRVQEHVRDWNAANGPLKASSGLRRQE